MKLKQSSNKCQILSFTKTIGKQQKQSATITC